MSHLLLCILAGLLICSVGIVIIMFNAEIDPADGEFDERDMYD